MRTTVVSVAVMMAALLPLLSRCSPSELTDEQLARCLAVSNELGSIGGSDQIISLAVVQLSDDEIAPAGSSDEEVEATFDRAFLSLYGIHVDDFLSIRRSADAATTERFGDPLGSANSSPPTTGSTTATQSCSTLGTTGTPAVMDRSHGPRRDNG